MTQQSSYWTFSNLFKRGWVTVFAQQMISFGFPLFLNQTLSLNSFWGSFILTFYQKQSFINITLIGSNFVGNLAAALWRTMFSYYVLCCFERSLESWYADYFKYYFQPQFELANYRSSLGVMQYFKCSFDWS